MARFFIDRPVFAWVIAIFLMVAGAISITQLPVAQYPTIASPSVSVRVAYPGATSETLHLMVTDLITQELNGADGLRYYEVSNEANGRATITATFQPGTNQDLAAVDVQNRIKRVEPRIPDAVKQQGITIEKANSGFLCMVAMYSPDGSKSNFDIGDYAARNVYNELKRVPGVGTAQLLASEKAMRIWVDPAKLVGYGLSFSEVNAAIREQNNQIPAGTLGTRPSPRVTQSTTILVASGQLENARQFEDIQLRANPDGSTVRLKDVATIELGAAEYGFEGHYDGKPAATIIIQSTPTANALETANGVRACMERLRPYFPKNAAGQPAIDFAIPYDTTPFINVSIGAVVRTLVEAIALVFVVMFLFLQNIRYTFIPIIVVPVALLGAFAVLLALHFSINVMTMFAMVLVIGILVDDAIVVVENVERIMREEHLPPREATRKAMKQITGAIIGMTLVLSSVFIPMAFFPGAVGIIYRQFSLTMVAAILFSALLALSLTPALCANLLKPHDAPLVKRRGIGAILFFLPDMFHKALFAPMFSGFPKALPAGVRVLVALLGLAFLGAFGFAGALPLAGEALMFARAALVFLGAYCLFVAGNGFNNIFEGLTRAYTTVTHHIVRLAFLMMLAYVAVVYGFGHFYSTLPKSFIPLEDQGNIINIIQLPPNASAHRTGLVFKQIEDFYAKDPAVQVTAGVIGFSFSGGGENSGMVFATLKPWDQRDAGHGRIAHAKALESAKKSGNKPMLAYLDRVNPEEFLSHTETRNRALAYFSQIRDTYIAMPILPPAIPELGMSDGVTFRLQDRGSKGHSALLQARGILLGMMYGDAMGPNPTLSANGTRPDGVEDSPQLEIKIDRDAAGAMGVSFGEITSVIATAIGSNYLNDFPSSGRMQRVIVQAQGNSRVNLEDLGNLYVHNKAGGLVPISAFTKFAWIMAPAQVISYNGYPTMRIEAGVAPGKTSGAVMAKIREFEGALRSMPGFDSFAVEWAKQTLEEYETNKPIIATEAGSWYSFLGKITMDQALIGISLLFVFLLMAALYESWSIPFAVMLVVPVGALGAVLAVVFRGYPNDIYFLIGMVAIVGLSAKNAILIIEFAKEQQLQGKDLLIATMEGARLRFRPILMTSFAFVLGVLPLFKASGAASASQRAIGTGVIGGMLASTLLGVFFIPAFYVVVRKLTGNRLSHYDKIHLQDLADKREQDEPSA